MTPSTLFNIILKVIGIFLLKDCLLLIPQVFSGVYGLFLPDSAGEGLVVIGFGVLTIAIYILAAFLLIGRTHLVIDKLKLEQGFEESSISIQIHRSTVLAIAVIVTGGLIFVDQLPELCRRIVSYVEEVRFTHGLKHPSADFLIVPAVKVILGLSLMAGQRKIVNLIERLRRQ